MKRTLVLGASLNPTRYSYLAVNRLVAKGHDVEAIGQRQGVVSGVHIRVDKPSFENIDTITIYLNPQRQKEFYEYILSLKPKRVIFNPGTENTILYNLLTENSIYFEVACTLVLLGTNQY